MTRDQCVVPANVEILHTAVEAFREREIGYREILEDLPAAIYTTDAEGRITYFNRACIEFSGRTPNLGEDQWCVSSKLYTTDGSELPHEECPMAVALKERRNVRGEEIIAERPDGSRIHFASFPTPIFDAAGECVGAVNMLIDITEQKQAQERLSLLAREIDHRSNNLLSLFHSLVRLTKAATVEEYQSELEGRVAALAKAHSLIADKRWSDVDLKTLVEEELGASPERIDMEGPDLNLSPASAQSIAMVVHELCTNAHKYGALSADSGEVRVAWAIDDSGAFMLTWEEDGGPATSEPVSKNTGNVIITAAVRQLKGQFFREWRAQGLRCTLLCDAANL